MSATNNALNPIENPSPRTYGDDDYTEAEVRLANRNSGMMLEMLHHDVTPAGTHYLLNHFDIPHIAEASDWRVTVDGCVSNPHSLSLAQLQELPVTTRRVTLECAGNGRALLSPRRQSQPWVYEAVGTAEWTGTSLSHVLNCAGLNSTANEVVFHGSDLGLDNGITHTFSRSLKADHALDDDILLVWAMNGQPLLPQHGFPLRLVVPGWYGMASVKWLNHIEVIDHAFQGHQQIKSYIYKTHPDDDGVAVSTIRVKSLMAPPGIAEWSSDRRLVEPGIINITGRAWSGGGVPITRVEFADNDKWHDAHILPTEDKYAWSKWQTEWQAAPGGHTLRCRATDANGNVQPLESPWDENGFGVNTCQIVRVWCTT